MPYRQLAIVKRHEKRKPKFRIVYDGHYNCDHYLACPKKSYHRFYWMAWLKAWWYCNFINVYGIADIQEYVSE